MSEVPLYIHARPTEWARAAVRPRVARQSNAFSRQTLPRTTRLNIMPAHISHCADPPAPRLTERTAAERAAAELAATVVAAELAAVVVVAERPLGLARGRSPDAGSSTSGPSRIYCEKTCSARARYANQLFSNARMSR